MTNYDEFGSNKVAPHRNHPDVNLTPRNSAASLVIRNSLANLSRIGAGWGVALLLPPLLVRVLNTPEYGAWILILQLAAYVSIFDGGMQNAIARFVARADGLSDRKYLSRIMSTAMMILGIMAVLTIALALLSYCKFSRFFSSIPSNVAVQSRNALLIVGLSLAASLPSSVFAGAFLGLQRNHVNALTSTFGKLTGAAGAAWAAFHHQGLLVMATWIAAGNLLQAATCTVYWYRFAPNNLIQRRNITIAAVREFTRFCYAMLLTQLGALLITGLDMPIVAKFDFRATAYYGIAAMFGNLIAVPQGAVVATFIPIAAGITGPDSGKRLGSVLIKVTRYANGLLCLIVLPIAFGLPLFLRIWVGSDYASHAIRFAEILALAQVIRLLLMPYATIGFAAGQQEKMLISPLVEGALNLFCSLAGVLLWGAIGVALGTLIGSCAGVLLHFTISMRRTNALVFSRSRLLARGINLPVMACLPSAVLLCLTWRPSYGPIPQIGLIFAGESLAGALLWRVVLQPDERRQILLRVSRMIKLRGAPDAAASE